MMVRRFPPPWAIDELEACFVVTDSAGQKLGRRSAAKLLSKDEARKDRQQYRQAARFFAKGLDGQR